MKKLLSFTLAGIAALVLGGAVRADDSAPKVEKPVIQTPVAAAPLTDESLAKMLTDMGYEYRAEPIKGTVIYHVKVTQDGWDYYLSIALSTDKQQLWISTTLVTLSDENVPATALLRLLEENEKIGPTTITYSKRFKQIGVSLPLLNRGGITPAVFRGGMNDLMANAKSVKKLCDFSKPAEKTLEGARVDHGK